jgi:hypothetical protein
VNSFLGRLHRLSINRLTGKTTRAVDEGIQILFNEGLLVIPHKNALMDALKNSNYSELLRAYPTNTILVDLDWRQSPRVQEYLVDRIIHRLKAEHSRFTISKGSSPEGNAMRIEVKEKRVGTVIEVKVVK